MQQQIVFSCPSCKTRLSVPLSLAGVSGPCPQCTRTITAPRPTATPMVTPVPQMQPAPQAHPQQQAPVQPVPQNYHFPLEQSQSPASGGVVTPAPRVAVKNTAEQPVVQENRSTNHHQTEKIPTMQPKSHHREHGHSGHSRRDRGEKTWTRILIPIAALLIMTVIGLACYYVLNRSNMWDAKSTTVKAPVESKVAIAKPTAENDPASANSTGDAATQKKSLKVVPAITPPDDTISAEKTVNAGEKPAGQVALTTAEDFLSASNFAARSKIIFTKKPNSELENSILAKEFPHSQLTPGLQNPNPEERLVEYFYDVEFGVNNLGMPDKVLLLLHQRGDELPKVLVEPFLDIVDGRLAKFLKTPSKDVLDVHVVINCRSKCFDDINVPNSAKKHVMLLRSHPDSTKSLGTAYFSEQSEFAKLFGDPLAEININWGDSKNAYVTLQWNQTEDPKRPFVEVVKVISLDWKQ